MPSTEWLFDLNEQIVFLFTKLALFFNGCIDKQNFPDGAIKTEKFCNFTVLLHIGHSQSKALDFHGFLKQHTILFVPIFKALDMNDTNIYVEIVLLTT